MNMTEINAKSIYVCENQILFKRTWANIQRSNNYNNIT